LRREKADALFSFKDANGKERRDIRLLRHA
jgi:hypothetical protein